MNRQNRYKVLNHVIYCALILFLFVLQTTPGLLTIADAKPALVLTAAIAIAVQEGEFVGGIYGIIAGIFMDSSSFGLFGFNAILVCIACVVVGLLARNLMQETLVSYLIYTFIISLVLSGLQFLFTYAIWRLPHAEKLFFSNVVVFVIYTTVISPINYYIFKALHRKFNS